MKKIVCIAFVTLIYPVIPASAGPFEDGLDTAKYGDLSLQQTTNANEVEKLIDESGSAYKLCIHDTENSENELGIKSCSDSIDIIVKLIHAIQLGYCKKSGKLDARKRGGTYYDRYIERCNRLEKWGTTSISALNVILGQTYYFRAVNYQKLRDEKRASADFRKAEALGID